MLSSCDTKTDKRGRELVRHGTARFPIACYYNELARKSVPWHWHEELEVLAVSEGTAVITAGTDRFVVKAGEGFFINTGVLHAVWDYEESGCRFRSAIFHPRLVGGSYGSVFWQDYVEPLTGSAERKYWHFNHTDTWHGQAVRAIMDAWDACAAEPRGYEFQVRGALSQLVFLVSGHCPDASKQPSKKALRDEARIKTMIQYISENYGAELNTASIARSAAISESECLRCFRSVIATPPMQYVKEFRLQKAADLLATTNQGIAEIGAQCGFMDASYFTKTFREWVGQPPSEYRKNPVPIGGPKP